MAIQRKPKSVSAEKAIDAFVSGAPDAAASKAAPATYDKGIAKGNRRQISLTITPELLRQVDEAAASMGIGRAGFICSAIFKEVEAIRAIKSN
jgi:hypothetical protein